MKIIIFIFLFLFNFLFSASTWAQCLPSRTLQTKTIVLTGGAITVGADLPNGSVIYRGTISAQDDPEGSGLYVCTIPVFPLLTLQVVTRLTTGTPVSPGIYATGLSGVGIRIYNNVTAGNTTTPLSMSSETLLREINYPVGNCVAGFNCWVNVTQAFRFELIKTGNILGGTIMGVNLPRIATIIHSLTPTTPVVGNGVTINLAFTGSLTILPATCTTPGDYAVDLGSYTAVALSTMSFTPWVAANINLTNCPAFTGMGTNSSNTYFGWDNPSSIGAYTNNIFKVTITPINALRAGADGVFLIDKSSASASGVDIQIHRGTVAANSPVIFNQSFDVAIGLGTSGNIPIPLLARYIRNNDPLRPGSIIGKVVFLIDYN